MSADPEDIVRQVQEAAPLESQEQPPAVFRSPSGRIVVTLKPWYDDDHELMMRELDELIDSFQHIRRECGGAQ